MIHLCRWDQPLRQNVGSQLAAELIRNGVEVVFGARNPTSEKTQAAVAAVPGAKAMSTADAATWCEALILAIPVSLRLQIREHAFAHTLEIAIEPPHLSTALLAPP